ncbi:MAG: CoA-binding protein [Bacillota bacterium]
MITVVVFANPEKELLAALLSESKTIAVVGLSPKTDRDSHRVAIYLKERGYRVVPVYPLEDLILGERVYRDLNDIPFPVDIVNIFRRSEEALPVVMNSLSLRPKAVWLQLGIINEKAVEPCREAGVPLIMDKCIMVEHRRIFGE